MVRNLLFLHFSFIQNIYTFIINMQAAVGAIGPLLRYLWPHLVGWGVNKLLDSRFGRTRIPQSLHPLIR